MQNNYPAYRADIDGLRAIAVTAVVGYHAFPQYIKGGFVGVDIFFVISGFLISSIILKLAPGGSFSVWDFYNRRIRRIFPALLTMLFVCLLAGRLLLFPDEMQQLGKHALGANLFITNFMFWDEAGYFDVASALKPLLHLWSLSIEEQFYALWPLTFLMLLKTKRPFLYVSILTISSLLLCVSGKLPQTANFYMPLSRIWELLCGGLLATYTLHHIKGGVPSNNLKMQSACAEVFSLIGIILLVLSIFVVINDKSIFPGWLSLLPTLGTVLIIAAGPSTLINRYMLGNRLSVFIGLISYPLYLWHWPFLSFPKITEGLLLSNSMKAIAITGAVTFAILTYYLIERPLRHRGILTSKLLLTFALLLAVTGLLFWKGIIQPKYSGEIFQKIAAAKSDVPHSPPLSKSDFITTDDHIEYFTIGNGPKTTLYIGDSFMHQYWSGVEITISAMHGARRAILGGCRIPFVHIYIGDDIDSVCNKYNAYFLSMAINDPNVDTVVFSSYWRTFWDHEYVEGTKTYPMKGYGSEGSRKAMEQLITNIREMKARGKTVYILLNVPFGVEFDPHNLIRRSLRGFHVVPHLEGGMSLKQHKYTTHELLPVTPLLEEIAHRSGAIILDPAEFLCKNDWCSAVTDEGEPIYRDIDHLRGSYSYYHPQFIAQTLR